METPLIAEQESNINDIASPKAIPANKVSSAIQIGQMQLRTWTDPSLLEGKCFYHNIQVFVGNRQKVSYEGNFIFVAVADVKKCGLHKALEKEQFQETISKTQTWLSTVTFSKDLSRDHSQADILYSMHRQNTSLTQDGLHAIAIQSPSSHWIWTMISPQKATIHDIAIVRVQNQKISIEKLRSLNIGSQASVYTSHGVAIRIPSQEKSRSIKERLQGQALLKMIHAQGSSIGVQPEPYTFSSIDPHAATVIDSQLVTIAPQAACNAYNLFSDKKLKHLCTDDNKHMIAHNITQGLKNCINAKVGNIDIKLENVLINTDPDAPSNVINAELIDFDGAIALDSLAHCNELLPCPDYKPAHTHNCVMNADINFLTTDNRNKNFKAYQERMNQIARFETGVLLFNLYTEEPLPCDYTSALYIKTVDTNKTKNLLQSTKLTQFQQQCIMRMLDVNPQNRPSAESVAALFSELKSSS